MPEDITLGALFARIEHAKQRMSRTNPHRLLLRQCQDALIQLAMVEVEAPAQGKDHATT